MLRSNQKVAINVGAIEIIYLEVASYVPYALSFCSELKEHILTLSLYTGGRSYICGPLTYASFAQSRTCGLHM